MTETETKRKAVENAKGYILSNWTGIQRSMKGIDKNIQCSAEEVICTPREMFAMENRNKKRLGSVADLPIYSIPYPHIKKIAALKNHIWGL